MRYKSLFRVLVKVIGVWMMAYAFSAAGSRVLIHIGADDVPFLATKSLPLQLLDWYGPPIIDLLIGLLLFFRSNWIANLAIPSNRPYCIECGYDLTAHTADNCPECGTAKAKGDGL